TLVSAYIGWRALKGDPRDAWIRSVAIAFAAIGGTSFRGATLTDTDFSQARLKSTDLRRAVLLRTRWRDAEKLDRVRPGETYLNNLKIQKLLLTGDGQGQAFDYLLNLHGINLQGANLVKADFTGSNLRDGTLQGANLANVSFIGANLNGAYLQDADLSDARLVQAQLDQADLTGATLTGAYIEDWGITTRTLLNGIRCDYVFMRLPSERNPAPNPHRKPDDWNKNFAEGEFVDFIAPMVETLDLYHNQTVDPRAVAIAFSDLRNQNPNAELEIISMEKRGQNLDKFNLRVRTNPQADRSQLHHQYFEQYEHLLDLPPQALIALLMEKEGKAQMLAGMINTAIAQPQSQIENYHNQGDTTMSQSDAGASKFDMRGAQIGSFAETVEGDQIGTQHNYATPEKQSLADAALEIQRLLKQLEETNPTATAAEQKAFVTAAIPATLRQRAVGALQSGGKAVVEEVLDNPYVNVAIAVIEGWQGA
ncbi:MAG: pentapeptide repeat-containing protein, partial [Cyanobacteria bacterium P01_F01_bin.4]